MSTGCRCPNCGRVNVVDGNASTDTGYGCGNCGREFIVPAGYQAFRQQVITPWRIFFALVIVILFILMLAGVH